MYRFFGTGSATLQEDLVDEAVERQMPTKETAELNPKEEKKPKDLSVLSAISVTVIQLDELELKNMLQLILL